MKSRQLTSLDNNQVARYSYDDDLQAQRVVVVGDLGISEALKDLKIEASVQGSSQVIIQKEYEKIEVPVIIKEIVYQEVPAQPIILKETKIVEIEKPVYIPEYKQVEVPIIIREKEIVYVDKMNYKLLFAAQGLTLLLILLSKFLK